MDPEHTLNSMHAANVPSPMVQATIAYMQFWKLEGNHRNWMELPVTCVQDLSEMTSINDN